MNIFLERAEVVRKADDQFDQIFFDFLKDNEKFILDLVRDEQLYQGLKFDGSEIKPDYAPSTVRRKRRRGQPYDRVTWKDKGDLYRSLQLKFGFLEFEIEATDRKIKKLYAKYGSDVLGLTDESIKRTIEYIGPMFIEKLQRMIYYGDES